MFNSNDMLVSPATDLIKYIIPWRDVGWVFRDRGPIPSEFRWSYGVDVLGELALL